jgi:thymidylate synthase
MEVYRGISADEVWCKAYQALAASAAAQAQSSRAGDTIEVLHAAMEIADPKQRWALSRVPSLNPAFAIAETLWILAGSNDAAAVNYWFPRLPEFSGKGATYAGAYGYRLRTQFDVDQFSRACDVLSANPASRQVVLQLWDARSDLPNVDGSPRASDIPCNVISMLKVRMGRLDWTQIMRSNDLFRGLPYNIIQFTILQEVMAGWLGLEVGRYHHWSDSLHVYVDALPKFSCSPTSAPAENTDSLAVDRRRGEALIRELYGRMVALTLADVDEAKLEDLVSLTEAPPAYQNLLRVLGSESARRRGRHSQAAGVMAGCTNAQLSQAWSAWLSRVQLA